MNKLIIIDLEESLAEGPKWGRRPQDGAGGPNLHQILLELSRIFSELSRLVMHALHARTAGVWSWASPEPPAGARIFWRVTPTNYSIYIFAM